MYSTKETEGHWIDFFLPDITRDLAVTESKGTHHKFISQSWIQAFGITIKELTSTRAGYKTISLRHFSSDDGGYVFKVNDMLVHRNTNPTSFLKAEKLGSF